MKRILAAVGIVGASLLLLCSCDGPTVDHEATQTSINNPVLVGTFPDGRKLYEVTVAFNGGYHNHYVYYFSTNDTTTISVNHEVSQGKTSFNQTIVIDGVTYQAVNTNK